MVQSTHFNPVVIVAVNKDINGNSFDLSGALSSLRASFNLFLKVISKISGNLACESIAVITEIGSTISLKNLWESLFTSAPIFL